MSIPIWQRTRPAAGRVPGADRAHPRCRHARGHRYRAQPRGARLSLDRQAGGHRGLGAADDSSVEYARDNNFYVPGQLFRVPEGWPTIARSAARPIRWSMVYSTRIRPNGPATAPAQRSRNSMTGTRRSRSTSGVRPMAAMIFDALPDYAQRDIADHYAYWEGRSVPCLDQVPQIVEYWQAMGVTASAMTWPRWCRWSSERLNSAIKRRNPEAFPAGRGLQPAEYCNYLRLGRMDYLYDKVDFYDSLKLVMQDRAAPMCWPRSRTVSSISISICCTFWKTMTSSASPVRSSPATPRSGARRCWFRPPSIVARRCSYFAQELGEPGAGDAGFGGQPDHDLRLLGRTEPAALEQPGCCSTVARPPGRTQPARLPRPAAELRADSPAMRGAYAEIHRVNRAPDAGHDDRLFALPAGAPSSACWSSPTSAAIAATSSIWRFPWTSSPTGIWTAARTRWSNNWAAD